MIAGLPIHACPYFPDKRPTNITRQKYRGPRQQAALSTLAARTTRWRMSGLSRRHCPPVPLVTFAWSIRLSRLIQAMIGHRNHLESRIHRDNFRMMEFVSE
jgi:hypothetical protein